MTGEKPADSERKCSMFSNPNLKDNARDDMAACSKEVFRKAREKDFAAVRDIFSEATAYMCSHGIMQWDEVYPTAADLLLDIGKREMYVLSDGGEIVSVIVVNEEQVEEYEKGSWRFGGKTAVLHRLCVHPSFSEQGIREKDCAFYRTDDERKRVFRCTP